MSMTITLTLDDEIGGYLERIASDQGRTLAEVAAWIVTEDVRHERAIDAELVSRLDGSKAGGDQPSTAPWTSVDEPRQRERAGA